MKKRIRPVRLDPVFTQTGYRCVYCDRDLLSDVDTFIVKVREHFTPRSVGGPDAQVNRVPSCGPCDRLKGGRVFATVDEARAFLSAARTSWASWVARLRQVVPASTPR